MPEGFIDTWNNIKKYWAELEKDQKIRLYITIGVLISAIIVVLVMSLRVDYVKLIAEGDEYDLKSIVEYLDETGYKYQKREGGEIYIDSKKKNDIEFDLSTDGIISPNLKFTDTWSQLSLTATESDKEQLWKDYEQKSLTYKLKKFENVVDAEVQFSKPEKTIWARPGQEQNKGSAWVRLTKRGELTDIQVQGVVKVVAASIGIPEESVTVVDESFNILNRNMADSSIGMVSTQEELRLRKQQELQENIFRHFKIGIVQYDNFDNFSVTVNPVLDFDKLISKETKYSASGEDGESLLNTREELTENLENGQAGAAPGIDSNPGTVSYQTGDSGNSSYSKSHEVEDYVHNVYEAETQKALGKFIAEDSSMTVSLYYGRVVADAAGLTNQFLEQVKTDASKATGIPVGNISVSIYKLAPEVIPDVSFADTAKQALNDYGYYALMIVLLIALAIAAVPRRKEDDEEEMEPAYAGVGPQFVVPDSDDMLPEIDMEQQSELRRQIDKFVTQKPDAVAQLLRNWLTDDWN